MQLEHLREIKKMEDTLENMYQGIVDIKGDGPEEEEIIEKLYEAVGEASCACAELRGL